MFNEKIDFSIPEDEILNIRFLKREGFYQQIFSGKEYTIVGNDDVDNMVGIDSKGMVWFLDTEMIFALYASKDLKTFVEQLQLYANWDHPDDDAPEKLISDNVEEFRREIIKMDTLAMSDDNSFWSLVIEQIEESFL